MIINYAARWVLPISAPPMADGVVSVRAGRIAYVGPRDGAPEGDYVDFGNAALLPGLVNAHTHLELTVMRGFLEELSFRPWITRLTETRRRLLNSQDLLASARTGIAEGLLSGITTFADTCESGVVFDALLSMRARGIMYQEVFGPDPAHCEASLRGLRDVVDRRRGEETALVRFGVSPHAPYSVSDALFSATARYATEMSLPLAVHVAESEAEVTLVRDGAGEFADALRARGIAVRPRGRSPLDMLDRTGVLSARALLIHCVRVSDDDIAAIARHDCAVAHCPASNAKLGHGVAPLAALLDAGVRVGFGSDSVASSNRMDLLDEGRLAALIQRASHKRYDILPASRVLELATLGSARALGLDAEIGSLEEGKSADLAAFPLDGVRNVPTFDPASALVFAYSGRPATFVAVAGEVLVRDGRLVTPIDADVEHLRRTAAIIANAGAAL